MRQQLTRLTASLCLLGIISAKAFGASNSQDMAQLAKQLAALQQQVNQLQAQLQAKNQQDMATARTARHAARSKKTQTGATNTAASSSGSLSPDAPSETPITGISTLPTSGTTYIPVDVDVPGQSFVSSGPYIGVPLQFSGSNLIVNTPSVNQDVALLKVRKNIHQRLQALGVIEEPDHAHVLLSGEVEGQGIYRDIGGGPTSTDLDLTNVTLDAYILGPSQWLSSLISFTYDNSSGTQSGSLASNSRDLNSRVYVNQGFFTIGNFSQTPFYGTMGQYFVPFGTYGSNMVSSPLTKILGRVKARALLLGYQPQFDSTLYASTYIFRGDTFTGSASTVNNGGINLGYRFKQGKFNGDIGAGVIRNLADSVGMQFVSNNATTFNGFGGINNTGSEKLVHGVPAYDIRAALDFSNSVDLITEYITAASAFSKSDLTMNSHGAKPRALDVELAYSFQGLARPISVAASYQMSKDGLALQLPAQRYSAVLNTSIWKDTLQSLEFRHDVNYAASSVSSGSNVLAPASSGKPDNAVTAQFDVYF